jgi:hypothetical protein
MAQSVKWVKTNWCKGLFSLLLHPDWLQDLSNLLFRGYQPSVSALRLNDSSLKWKPATALVGIKWFRHEAGIHLQLVK